MSGIWAYITSEGKWIAYVFLIVFFVLLVNYGLKLFLNVLARKVGATKNPWDDAFIEAVRKPLRFLVWVIGISFAATIVDKLGDKNDLLPFINNIRTAGIIFLFAWFLLRLAKSVEKNIKKLKEEDDNNYDHTTLEAVSKLLRIAIFITAALVTMEHFEIPIAGVLTFGGIGGIAIGFAARDLLANFFGAMMIYMDRPFTVGDWIRSPDRNIEGTVESIGWRLTRIRTFNKRPLYVPNSIFSGIAVENPSRMSNRRIKETIGIRYDDAEKMGIIVTKVKQMLQAHEAIEQNQTLIVNFNAFAPSSLDFFIYTFTKTTNWVQFHAIKQDVMLKIIEIIVEEGAECAFPTSTLHIPNTVAVESFSATKKKITAKKKTSKKKTSKKKTNKKESSKKDSADDKKTDDLVTGADNKSEESTGSKSKTAFDNDDETFKNEMSDDDGGE